MFWVPRVGCDEYECNNDSELYMETKLALQDVIASKRLMVIFLLSCNLYIFWRPMEANQYLGGNPDFHFT